MRLVERHKQPDRFTVPRQHHSRGQWNYRYYRKLNRLDAGGFVFRMDYTQYTAAQAAAFTGLNFTNNRIGLAASASNAGGAPDTFYLDLGSNFSEPPLPAPEPASLLTVGAGLLGLALLLRRRLGNQTH